MSTTREEKPKRYRVYCIAAGATKYYWRSSCGASNQWYLGLKLAKFLTLEQAQKIAHDCGGAIEEVT